jgi:hypothetical protein
VQCFICFSTPVYPGAQWVLSLPFSLRPIVGYDAELFACVTRIFMGEVFRVLRKKARRAGVASPVCAGVAVLQRAGNAIDLNPHLHAIVLDGVFVDRVPDAPDADTPRLDLVPLAAPDDQDLVTVSRRVCIRLLDLLKRRGRADAEGLCPPDEPPPMGPRVEAAARVRSRFAYVDHDGNVWPVEERLTAGGSAETGFFRGFSTHAAVAAQRAIFCGRGASSATSSSLPSPRRK